MASTPVILAPSFGDNYDIGYIGFTSPVTQEDVVSVGIAYFENYHKLSDISVTHAFIVTGEHTCIEAVASGRTSWNSSWQFSWEPLKASVVIGNLDKF